MIKMMTMTKEEEPTFLDLPDCFASSWPTLDSDVSPSALCYFSPPPWSFSAFLPFWPVLPSDSEQTQLDPFPPLPSWTFAAAACSYTSWTLSQSHSRDPSYGCSWCDSSVSFGECCKRDRLLHCLLCWTLGSWCFWSWSPFPHLHCPPIVNFIKFCHEIKSWYISWYLLIVSCWVGL